MHNYIGQQKKKDDVLTTKYPGLGAGFYPTFAAYAK